MHRRAAEVSYSSSRGCATEVSLLLLCAYAMRLIDRAMLHMYELCAGAELCAESSAVNSDEDVIDGDARPNTSMCMWRSDLESVCECMGRQNWLQC